MENLIVNGFELPQEFCDKYGIEELDDALFIRYNGFAMVIQAEDQKNLRFFCNEVTWDLKTDGMSFTFWREMTHAQITVFNHVKEGGQNEIF